MGITTQLNDGVLIAYIGGLTERTGAVVEATAKQILADAETAMSLPKSGRMYGTHQASAPGDAPAIDTRELIESGSVEMVGPTSAEVRWTSEHAEYMEFGTEDTEPRPFATPAAEANRQKFIDDMATNAVRP